MMSIQVLTQGVAAKIAAGEVVERPASVVKELMENSIDANVTQISIEVKGGGLRLIQVVDNGMGIPSDQVETALQRHATSKIIYAEDLDNIRTLGFRGEALPSIAAVSELELTTRTKNDLAGTRILSEGGAITGRHPASRPVGTTVIVRRLFQNVPARLKFMKTAATENGRISAIVSRYGLAYPEIRFILTVDGRHSFSSTGSGNLKDVLAKIYGVETSEAMLEVVGEVDGVGKVSGFVGPPSVNRAQRGYITLFVNRRWIQDRRLTYAVEEAFQGLLMVDRHPVAVLELSLPLADVDVNVHPAKSEVRFRHDREVFSLVQRAVRQTLVGESPVRVVSTGSIYSSPKSAETSSAKPLGSDLMGWAKGPRVEAGPEGEVPVSVDTPMETLPILRVVGQVGNTYIVAEAPSGMYLIDQHAAHERVLFERVQRERQEKGVQSQGMLYPETVEVTPAQQETLGPKSELLKEYGFDFELFGDRSYIFRAVPATLAERDPSQTFIDILDSLSGGQSGDDWEGKVAASIACRSAVRAGDVLERTEMEELMLLLERVANPHTCPHGRPIMIHLSSTHLEKEFGRR